MSETEAKLKAELDALVAHFQQRQIGIEDAAVLMAVSMGMYMKTAAPDDETRYHRLVELAGSMMAAGGVTRRPKRRWKLNG